MVQGIRLKGGFGRRLCVLYGMIHDDMKWVTKAMKSMTEKKRGCCLFICIPFLSFACGSSAQFTVLYPSVVSKMPHTHPIPLFYVGHTIRSCHPPLPVSRVWLVHYIHIYVHVHARRLCCPARRPNRFTASPHGSQGPRRRRLPRQGRGGKVKQAAGLPVRRPQHAGGKGARRRG